MILRGYAIPFDRRAFHNGRQEYVDPTAFRAQVKSGAGNVFLNLNDHSAPALKTGKVTLFADSYGLGLKCYLDGDAWKALRPYLVGSHRQCSIQTSAERTKVEREYGGHVHRIVEATVEHICICHSPAYRGTGVWPDPDSIIGDLPPALAALNARWEEGFAQYESREAARCWVRGEIAAKRRMRARVDAIMREHDRAVMMRGFGGM